MPRLINRICDRALARAYSSRTRTIDAAIVLKALDNLGLRQISMVSSQPPALEIPQVIKSLAEEFRANAARSLINRCPACRTTSTHRRAAGCRGPSGSDLVCSYPGDRWPWCDRDASISTSRSATHGAGAKHRAGGTPSHRSRMRTQISNGAFASAETLDIRHAGCTYVPERLNTTVAESSPENLLGDRSESSVGCCQRPFLVHRFTDEKAALVVGICLLTTNELNACMRKRTSAFVNDLTRTLCPWAWRYDGGAFADRPHLQRSVNPGLCVTTDANMIPADQLKAPKIKIDWVSICHPAARRSGTTRRCRPSHVLPGHLTAE